MIQLRINGQLYAFDGQSSYSLLLNALSREIPINYRCIGGVCGNCKVKVLRGSENLTTTTRFEELRLGADLLQEGYRLGCQTKALADVEVEQVYAKRVVGKPYDALPDILKLNPKTRRVVNEE